MAQNGTVEVLWRASNRVLRLSAVLLPLIGIFVAFWPVSASAGPQGAQSLTSLSTADDKSSDVWQIIKAAIQTAQSKDNAARRADRIAASFNMVDARIWSQPDPKVIHIDGQSRSVGALATVGFLDRDGTAAEESVFFDTYMPMRDGTPTPCIKYLDVSNDLRSLGGGNRLDRDIGLEGLHLPSATVTLHSNTLLAFVRFYVPVDDAGPICLTSVSVRNYDGGVPAWANASRQ